MGYLLAIKNLETEKRGILMHNDMPCQFDDRCAVLEYLSDMMRQGSKGGIPDHILMMMMVKMNPVIVKAPEKAIDLLGYLEQVDDGNFYGSEMEITGGIHIQLAYTTSKIMELVERRDQERTNELSRESLIASLRQQ